MNDAARRRSRVLVVEDDPAILRGLCDALALERYEVISATTGTDGLRLLRGRRPDLVILDAMLPGIDGFELCRTARAEGITMPIVMLTARGLEADRVKGLDLGADDYVTKPFSLPELLARVRAQLRRVRPEDQLPDRLELDDIVIDFTRYEASKGGQRLQLSPKEFGILRLLGARAGEVVSRRELLEEVWGYESFPTTRTVDNHIASLRAKLGDDAAQPRRLVTIHGVGYKLQFTNS
ncbi:MAG: response regulator transcription factor [Gemmatimonadota bacterium]